jgi:undecaprenyl-diphosphatase
MTAPRGAGAAMSATITTRAHAIIENARDAIALLLRPQPARSVRLVPAWRRYFVPGVLAAAAVALAMILVDQRAYQFASGLPPWLVDGFYAITDFGRSGWILVPTGGLIVIIALLASPALDHMTRGALAMLVVRLGFIFIAVGLPVSSSPSSSAGSGGSGRRRRVRLPMNRFLAPGIASLPSGHTTTAFRGTRRHRRDVPARPFPCGAPLLIASSRIMVTAHYSSDVIAGPRSVRSVRCGCAIGSRAAASASSWDGRCGARACGPSPNRIKGCSGR